MYLSTITTLSLFVGASIASVLEVPQDVVARDVAGPHPHGSCGGSGRHTCHGSDFGLCCSKNGQCGSSARHCGSGCQNSYGHCRHAARPHGKPNHHGGGPIIVLPAPTSGYVLPSSIALAQSSNGRCGANYRFTCNGTRWGNCCSEDAFCGSTDSFCGEGCQEEYGECSAVAAIGSSSAVASATSSSAAIAPSSLALPISVDGTCGAAVGFTCQGSTFGACCGADGFCGLGASCGTGCQTGFGICAAVSSSAVMSMSSVASLIDTPSSAPSLTPSSSGIVDALSSAVSSVEASISSVQASIISSIVAQASASAASASDASASVASASDSLSPTPTPSSSASPSIILQNTVISM